MPGKRKKNGEAVNQTEALKRRVDAMMDPRQPDASPDMAHPKRSAAATPPPIDIFKDTAVSSAVPDGVSDSATTAPEVSDDLLRRINTGPKQTTGLEDTAPVTASRRTREQHAAVQKTPNEETHQLTAPRAEPKLEQPAPQSSETAKDPGQVIDKKPLDIKPGPLEDKDTDQAVEDIASKEGDTILALQDAIGKKASRVAGDLAQQDKARRSRHHAQVWFLVLLLLIALFLFVSPYTRYTCHWSPGIRLRFMTDIFPSVCK